jgi:cell fate regulator YaaT (PSP1 superfamily)
MNTVKTDAARKQDISLNASRLAGQCGKLKCCLNYELETYLEAWESFPAELINLETDRGLLKPMNADVLKGEVQYAFDAPILTNRYAISIEQVKKYISLNKEGKLVETSRIEDKKDVPPAQYIQ